MLAGKLSMLVAALVGCLCKRDFCVFLLACQGITLPQMYTAAVANIINVAANYTLIFSLEWGVVWVWISVSLHFLMLKLTLHWIFLQNVIVRRRAITASYAIRDQKKQRHSQSRVFIFLYLAQSRSQCRAHQQQRAVDLVAAGQTSDCGGSRLRQSMRTDGIRYEVQRSHRRRLASRANVTKQIKWWVIFVCRGSAIANSLSQVVTCLLLYGYIRWKGLHKKTWGGRSTTVQIRSKPPITKVQRCAGWNWAKRLPDRVWRCRMVHRVSARMGPLHEAGHPQRLDGLFRMVDLGGWWLSCRSVLQLLPLKTFRGERISFPSGAVLSIPFEVTSPHQCVVQ